MLLESWREFEKEFGTDNSIERVRELLPEKVKKRRKLTAEDGVRSRDQWIMSISILLHEKYHFKISFIHSFKLNREPQCVWIEETHSFSEINGSST